MDYREEAYKITNDTNAIEKLLRENHELKRTRSEAEATARIEGYKRGQVDLKSDIRLMLGINK
jgi:hypothetical protein